MFGYINKKDLFETLACEVKLQKRMADLHTRLAAEAETDEEFLRYFDESKAYKARHEEAVAILSKLERLY